MDRKGSEKSYSRYIVNPYNPTSIWRNEKIESRAKTSRVTLTKVVPLRVVAMM